MAFLDVPTTELRSFHSLLQRRCTCRYIQTAYASVDFQVSSTDGIAVHNGTLLECWRVFVLDLATNPMGSNRTSSGGLPETQTRSLHVTSCVTTGRLQCCSFCSYASKILSLGVCKSHCSRCISRMC